ncbi:MAG: phage tail protein [Deltaproteobacteria bacterium]|nr:phage tail protein [Deltaproteobacteria bacterium]
MSLLELLNARTPGADQQNKVYGVVVGIVRDIKDPLNLGRVKVDFPWMGEAAEAVSISSEEDRAHSYWARIATLMAGSGRGTYFVPEVGEEVLVAFEHGDLDRPFVIGSLWNADDEPPESMDGEGKNHLRTIHSRSGHVLTFDDNIDEEKARLIIKSQGGHEIHLDDGKGQEKIELKTKEGHTITLDDAAGTVTLADKAGNEMVLDSNANSLTVKTGGNQDQTVGGNLTINVTGTVTISAPSAITLDATSIKLGSSAALTLVNDTFLDIFNAHFHVGNLGAPTSPPTVPAIKSVQSTIFTKGA